MKLLFVLNDPPYGTERCYKAQRLAHALLKLDAAAEITVFLMADAVSAARRGQETPDGYYNRVLKRVVSSKGRLILCGACMDARGMERDHRRRGPQHNGRTGRSRAQADRVMVF